MKEHSRNDKQTNKKHFCSLRPRLIEYIFFHENFSVFSSFFCSLFFLFLRFKGQCVVSNVRCCKKRTEKKRRKQQETAFKKQTIENGQ